MSRGFIYSALHRDLIEPHQIVINSWPYKKPTNGYVYFLINDQRVVYVGQTVDLDRRLYEHVAVGKVFDRYYALECPIEHLNACESAYISLCLPEMNKVRPGKGRRPQEVFREITKKVGGR